MIKVGQEVIVKKVGNAARHIKNDADLISKAIVKSVGRKYFTLIDYERCRFGIENMRQISDYTPNYVVYESEQQVKDEMEVGKIRKFIEYYPFGKLSLEKLRDIELLLKDAK